MILRTANAYAFSSLHRQRNASVLIIIGIAAALAALITVVGIMNSLQGVQLTRIRNAESFDISLSGDNIDIEKVREIDGVASAWAYLDIAGLAMNTDTDKVGYVTVRGIESGLVKDTRFCSTVNAYLPGQGICLGRGLSSDLEIRSYGTLKLTILKKGKTAKLVPFSATVDVGGFFYTSYEGFSDSYALMNLDELRAMSGFERSDVGVYLQPGADLRAVRKNLGQAFPDAVITDWKEANSSLYSALMLEKGAVIVFLGFIMLIISYYLKRSTRRMITAKRKEAAVFQALGLTRVKISAVFLVQAMEVSLIGIILGLLLGTLISKNLTGLLKGLDSLVRLFTGKATVLSTYPFTVSISTAEILLFPAGILICAFFFSLTGAKSAMKIDVMEILKDDARN